MRVVVLPSSGAPALFVSGSLDRTPEGDRPAVPLVIVLSSRHGGFLALRKTIQASRPSCGELSAADHREAGRILDM
jgi:hypothetical protein